MSVEQGRMIMRDINECIIIIIIIIIIIVIIIIIIVIISLPGIF